MPAFAPPALPRTARAARGACAPVCAARGPGAGARAAAERVADALRRDLPRQYDAPARMDFGVYDPRIRFTDPVTQLRGALMYKGMIVTIAVIARVLFRPETVRFELAECFVDGGDGGDGSDAEDSKAGAVVVTRFLTEGKTRWAGEATPPLVISGTDRFHVSPETARVVWHESLWDQSADEVKAAFFRR